MVTNWRHRSRLGWLSLGVLLALPGSAFAQPQQFVLPYNGVLENPCTAEWVTVEGTSTITINQMLDGNGGLHISVAVVTRGTGVGQTTGTQYPFNESERFSFRGVLNAQASASTAQKTRLRGPGPIDNWDLRSMLHVTVDANGTAHAIIDTFSSNCRG